MRPKVVTLTGVAADDNGIVTSVTPAAGGEQSLTLLAAAASLDPPRRLEVTTAADETARTITVTGVDRYGIPRTESFSLVDTGAALSTWEYQSISEILIDDDTTGAIIAGWNNVLYTQWIPLNRYRTPFNVSLGVQIITAGASVNYTVQHSLQDWLMKDGAKGHNALDNQVFDHENLASKTAADDGNYAYPISAVRLKANSIDASAQVQMVVQQAG